MLYFANRHEEILWKCVQQRLLGPECAHRDGFVGETGESTGRPGSDGHQMQKVSKFLHKFLYLINRLFAKALF